MKRLTHERCNGIKTGYWSSEKREALVNALAAYENTKLTPDQSPKNIEKIREGEYCCPKCYTVYDDCIFEYDYCINCGQAIRWNENLEGMEDE